MRDVIEGIVLVLLSLFAIWGAWQVPAASPGDTWAGIAPFAASVALLALSGLVLMNGLRLVQSRQVVVEESDTSTLDILILFALL